MALEQRARSVRRVLLLILVANWVVAALKAIWGISTDSAAMTADGLHSFIDGSSNVVGLVAMSFAAQPPDADHPYGHGKFEALAALAIGALVGAGALELGRMAFDALVRDHHPSPSPTAIGVMVGTLAVNVVVTTLEHRAGKRLKSALLLADARHTLSDVLVSLCVIASLVLVWLGYPRADGVIALGVMGVVVFVAYGIVRQAVGTLADAARLSPQAVAEAARAVSGVSAVRRIRSRGPEDSVYVDLAIEVDPTLALNAAHSIADQVESALAERFPEVVDVVVHVEPHRP